MVNNEDHAKYKTAFNNQKSQSKERGIVWQLTFDEWLSWWGDDIANRGRGKDKLQMQRYSDTGPYALGNIKKGFPVDNASTAASVARNKKTERAKKAHEAFLDSLMFSESKEAPDEETYKDEHWTPAGDYTGHNYLHKSLDG
jgi:hypothetical protein